MADARVGEYNPATDHDGPAFESSQYQAMLRDVTIVNDCYEGTSAIAAKAYGSIRNAAIADEVPCAYLPRYGAEDVRDYQERVAMSKFWNAFRRTVHGLVGLIFRRNPIVQDDIPDEIKADLQDVDMQGAHLDVFAKERCLKGMIDGHCFILVDKPKAEIEPGNAAGIATAADLQRADLRPYWVPVNLNQVPSWRVEKVNGIDTLTQVVIRECTMEPSGEFGETIIDRYRVLRVGNWALWEYDETAKEWSVTDEGETGLTYIPLVPFYTLQTGYFTSTPPLLDIAHENLRHYRLQSSLDRVLDLCNVPTPVRIGADEATRAKGLVVGFNVIDVPIGGDVKFLEPSGVAVESTQNEIDRCKANIASLGMLLLASQPQVKRTATEVITENTSEMAELGAIARNLQDCLERCVRINADYRKITLNISEDGGIRVNKDFVKVAIDPQVWQRLQEDEKEGRLTLESYLAAIEQYEVYAESFNLKKEVAALKQQPTLTKLQMERARVNLEADRQAVSGNPADIQRRIMEGAGMGAN